MGRLKSDYSLTTRYRQNNQNMEPRIEILEPKKLIGIPMEMTLTDNKTGMLWQTFMPRRNEVKMRSTKDYISMQIYGKNWNFSPRKPFTKWAAVEVSEFSEVPSGMKTHILNGGLYTVFMHKGPAATAPKTMEYIFLNWLPESAYKLDEREHFEVLPEGYNPVYEKANEEIWIPIKKR